MNTRNALALSFLDRYAGLFIGIGSSMAISRLLSPNQIGVFSVTMVLVSMLATVRDMGAGQYLVREPELTDAKIRSTWALQLGIGLFLAVVAGLLAIPAARFYRQPEVESILFILSINFAINPFGSITVAWWTREMQFQWIALMRFSGAITSAVVSIGLAWAGYGPVSLAWASLATTVASVIVSTVFRPGHLPWLPGLAEIRNVFSFGSRLTTVSIFKTLSDGAPEALLGRLQDMTQTGLLSRANGLVSMFDRLVMDAVGPVIFPLFSRKERMGEHLGEAYLRALGLITALGWSFLAGLAIAVFPVIRILYGGQWDGAMAVTQIFCIWGGLILLSGISEAILVVKNLMKSVLSIALLNLVIKVSASFLGAWWGLNELAWMLTLSALITNLIWINKVRSILGFGWNELGRVVLSSAFVAASSSFPLLVVRLTVGLNEGMADWPKLILAGVLMPIGFVLSARMVRHPIYEELTKALGYAVKKYTISKGGG